jgi:DNA helicase-2/ATP-dependent DNA helicase PcrA
MDLSAVHIFEGLNDSQKEAVTAGGPVLVVAGPGTGKTLTIVRRIAYLAAQGVRPDNILAVTFTNRAAREMRERVDALPGDAARNAFIGTFHLLGLRIIRESLGGDLALYSREEQVEVLKPLVKGSLRKAQQAVERISRIKNGAEEADDEAKILLENYRSALARDNAFDFDDLILRPVELLRDSVVLKRYQDLFSHIIVDEYQDINPAQYRLLRLLTGEGSGLCVVGDADQAIYAFRGADARNFLDFEKDFPGARRIVLSENYRSTGSVVAASESVIRNNSKRIARELEPVREKGSGITVMSVPDERAEGAAVIGEIEAFMGGTSRYHHYRNAAVPGEAECSHRFSDFAVIYRTNAQAKAIEAAFGESGIPYQVIGRKDSRRNKETEDMIAYLRSIVSPGHGADGSADPMEAKLISEADFFDPRADAVALLSMHMAKGLEFRVVFIAGCEEGLIPYTIMKDNTDVEEERRLFYVGMTRAKDELYLLCARKRSLYGRTFSPSPSPFLDEIPRELLQTLTVSDRMKKEKPQERQMGLF